MPPTEPRSPRWLVPGLVALFAIVVIRTAWLSEDAYFTFRTVDNWIAGYGARWNVAERVQVYTHPLWFALTSVLFFVTRDMTVAAFALCFLCTAGTVDILVRRMSASVAGTAMAMGLLIASKAFVDYSTSGLENPLSHLLLLGFFASFWAAEDGDPRVAERKLLGACVFGGLLVCNRMDLGLVLAPALLYSLWPPRLSARRVLAVALGFSPLVLWKLVSLVYYGFLVPNTAYAKLGADVTTDFIVSQGARYFENSLEWDPVTLLGIAVIAIASLRQLRARPRQACAALGALLYLAYVFSIGGGYMSGRFFTAPLVIVAGLLANQPRIPRPVVVVGSTVMVILAFLAPNPTLLSGRDYHEHRLQTDTLIDDERGYRFRFAGLLSNRDSRFLVNDPWYRQGLEARDQAEAAGETLVLVDPNGGYMGYAAGPAVHYINPYAITDPLLARLPGDAHGPGHFWRQPPAGYTRAAIGLGELEDPNLEAYWRDLALITRGPIWSKARWAAIWRMHTGADEHLLDAYLHTRLAYAEVSGPDTEPIALRSGGASVRLDGVHTSDVIEVHVELDDVYAIELARAGEPVFRTEIGETAEQRKNRLVLFRIDLPAEVAAAGYDELRVIPVAGDGLYRLGQLRILTHEQADAEQAEN